MCDPSNPIRQALQEVIVNLLSPDPSVRQLAEQQVLALQVTDGKTLQNFVKYYNSCRDLHGKFNRRKEEPKCALIYSGS